MNQASKTRGILFIAIFAVIGTAVLLLIFAQSGSPRFEAESVELINASKCQDGAASNGSFTSFGLDCENPPVAGTIPEGMCIPEAASQCDTYVYPSDAGLVDVSKLSGCSNNGDTDCTAAINSALKNARNGNGITLYFPPGTYLVSDALIWRNTNWSAFRSFQGAGAEKTFIKLKDNAAGYNNPSDPKAVIFTASEQTHSQREPGQGNEAYLNFVRDMTVLTGSGNSGAVGVDFIGSNFAAVGNVNVRSDDGNGYAGIVIGRAYNGPASVRNVVIDGFDYGIDSRDIISDSYRAFRANMVIEYALLRNQKKAAVTVGEMPLSIHGLASRNSVPVIQTTGGRSDVSVINGDWTGGSGPAVTNSSGAMVFARNISMSGYSSFGVGSNASGYLEEYSSLAPQSLFSNAGKTLRLPIKDTPTYHTNDLNDWANAAQGGLQAALNSGKSIVYIPDGYRPADGSYTVPASVRRIEGFQNEENFRWNITYRVNADSNNPVIFRGIHWSIINHTADRDVVSIDNRQTRYSSSPGAGDLYLDDVCCGNFTLQSGQNMWARQFNVETSNTQFTNNGGDAWILGYKSENPGQSFNLEGGRTEVFGGNLIPLTNPSAGDYRDPIFKLNNGAQGNIVLRADLQSNGGAPPQNAVIQTQNGQTRKLPIGSIHQLGSIKYLPIFYGNTSTVSELAAWTFPY